MFWSFMLRKFKSSSMKFSSDKYYVCLVYPEATFPIIQIAWANIGAVFLLKFDILTVFLNSLTQPVFIRSLIYLKSGYWEI